MSGGGYRPPSSPRDPRLSGDPEYTGRHRADGWVDTGVLTSDDIARQRAAEADGTSSSLMSSYVVSHLRTLVPLIWGAGITWLADRYLPAAAQYANDPTVLTIVTSGATFLWYVLWRWLEPWLPRVVTAVALGHPAPPSYPD